MSLQFFAGLDKARGDLGEREAQQRAPGGEDEIQAGGDQFLVPAVDLAQAALGAVAVDGIADRGPGGDHAHAGRAGRLADAFSDDRQALATLLTTGGEDLAAATGGLAGAKTDLAGAFLAMRAECRLHSFMAKRGSDSRDGRGGVKREVWETFCP